MHPSSLFVPSSQAPPSLVFPPPNQWICPFAQIQSFAEDLPNRSNRPEADVRGGTQTTRSDSSEQAVLGSVSTWSVAWPIPKRSFSFSHSRNESSPRRMAARHHQMRGEARFPSCSSTKCAGRELPAPRSPPKETRQLFPTSRPDGTAFSDMVTLSRKRPHGRGAGRSSHPANGHLALRGIRAWT